MVTFIEINDTSSKHENHVCINYMFLSFQTDQNNLCKSVHVVRSYELCTNCYSMRSATGSAASTATAAGMCYCHSRSVFSRRWWWLQTFQVQRSW